MLLEQATLMSDHAKVAMERIKYTHEQSENIEPGLNVNRSLVVSIASELSDIVIGSVFAELAKCQPRKVTVAVGAGTRIEDQILAGTVDLGLVCGTSCRPGLVSANHADERLVLAFGPSLLRESDAITPKIHAFGALPMVLPTWEHSTRRVVEQLALRAGIKFRVYAEIGDFAALKSLLRQGIGYGILPRCAIRAETARGALCEIPLEGNGARVDVSLIRRKERHCCEAFAAASAALASAVDSLGIGGRRE
jgi:LysR family nitrogen assimilation transcriptional regulator